MAAAAQAAAEKLIFPEKILPAMPIRHWCKFVCFHGDVRRKIKPLGTKAAWLAGMSGCKFQIAPGFLFDYQEVR